MPRDDPARAEDTTDPQAVLDLAEQLVDLAPEDPEHWLMLGYAREKLAWGGEAIDEWKHAPWVQFHPTVEDWIAWKEGEIDADFPYQEGQAEFYELMESVSRDTESQRWDFEHPPEYRAHSSFVRRLETRAGLARTGMRVRRNSDLRKRALGRTRTALLDSAFNAYLEASSLGVTNAHLDVLRPVVFRFKQLAHFEPPDRDSEMDGPHLSKASEELPTDPFPFREFFENLREADVSPFQVAVLRLEVLLEPASPGFTFEDWKGVPNSSEMAIEQPGFLAEEAFSAFQAGLDQLRDNGEIPILKPKPPGGMDALPTDRDWSSIPAFLHLLYDSATGGSPDGLTLMKLLMLYAYCEENSADKLVALSLAQQFEATIQDPLENEPGASFSLDPFFTETLEVSLGDAATDLGLEPDTCLGFSKGE